MTSFPIAKIREAEVLRRAACSDPSEEELRLLRECCRDGEYLIDYHIVERNRPMELLKDETLKARIGMCDALIIFTASLGDAFREQMEGDDPEKMIFYRALAAERLDALAEAYCDKKEQQLSVGGAFLTPHYPYSWEGVPEDSFTMTRIMGVSFDPEAHAPVRCRQCFKENCPNRREEAEKH